MIRFVANLLANNSLSVFLFHKVPNDACALTPGELTLAGFEKLLDLITAHFDVVDLASGIASVRAGTASRPLAAITFDDGYAEWVDGVARVLLRRGLPATFFITVGQFDGRPMWHERLANILNRFHGEMLPTVAYRLPNVAVRTPQERVAALRTLEFHFKYLPLRLRDEYIAALETDVGANVHQVPRMTADDLKTIAGWGFEIGGHTIDHPILSLCDSNDAKEEIGRTREILEGIIRRPVRAFAYPNGRPRVDYSSRHVEFVKGAGYSCAVSTDWGVTRAHTSPYQVPRFTPWGPSRLSMAYQLMRNMRAPTGTVVEAM